MTKPRTPFGDLEARIGLVPLEELLAERDALVKTLAPLWAKHGSNGTYEAQRKTEWTKIATVLRTEALLSEGKRPTEAEILQRAHADDRYLGFILQATKERALLYEGENRIQGITDAVNRGQAVCRYLSQELGLTPR